MIAYVTKQPLSRPTPTRRKLVPPSQEPSLRCHEPTAPSLPRSERPEPQRVPGWSPRCGSERPPRTRTWESSRQPPASQAATELVSPRSMASRWGSQLPIYPSGVIAEHWPSRATAAPAPPPAQGAAVAARRMNHSQRRSDGRGRGEAASASCSCLHSSCLPSATETRSA